MGRIVQYLESRNVSPLSIYANHMDANMYLRAYLCHMLQASEQLHGQAQKTQKQLVAHTWRNLNTMQPK